MDDTLTLLNIATTVAGGLGIFLLGMKNLSEGLQAVGGARLRRFMGLAAGNPLAAVGTGVTSTMIVQSSSVITVMLVGFVTSGMMTLAQAINVIIGANIGTTGTVWIVAFAPSPESLGLGALAVGGALHFFTRRERLHDVGLAAIGLGLVFLGMYFMSKGVMPIRRHAGVQALFASMEAKSIAGVALVALVSAAFTAVIQSSAAAIAIAMTLATQQLISYEVAVATLFGANIGTTATAWLAAIGAPPEAKRTALAHTLSNVIGSAVCIPFVLDAFVPMGKALFPGWNAVTETARGPALLGIAAPIAVTDTVFSLLRGFMLFPFVKPFSRLVERLVPAGGEGRVALPELLPGAKIAPLIAIEQAFAAVAIMRDSTSKALLLAEKVLSGKATEHDEAKILRIEDDLDRSQHDVTKFLGALMSGRLAASAAESARRLLRIADEIESVSDEAATIVKAKRRLRREGQDFSGVSRDRLCGLCSATLSFATRTAALLVSPRPEVPLDEIREESKALHLRVRESRQNQLARIGPDDPSSAARVLVELDIMNALERVRAYCLNIAETIAA